MGWMQLPLLLPKQTGLSRWSPKPHPMPGEAQSSIAFCPYICTCIPTPPPHPSQLDCLLAMRLCRHPYTALTHTAPSPLPQGTASRRLQDDGRLDFQRGVCLHPHAEPAGGGQLEAGDRRPPTAQDRCRRPGHVVRPHAACIHKHMCRQAPSICSVVPPPGAAPRTCRRTAGGGTRPIPIWAPLIPLP